MAAQVPVTDKDKRDSKIFADYFSSKDFKLRKDQQVDMSSRSIDGIGASSNPRRSNQDRFLTGKVNAEVTEFLDGLLDHGNLTEHGWLFLQIFNKLMATELKYCIQGGACVGFAYNGQNGGFGFFVGDTEFKIASEKDKKITIPLCTKTHHADNPDEAERLARFKPFDCVERDSNGILRLNKLHPTHTYGDHNSRDYGLSSSPIIASWPTLKAEESVWLHSDGGTDILKTGKTINYDASLKKMADDLCYTASTSDDVTVLILKANSTLGFIADGHGSDGGKVADLAVDNLENCLIQAMNAVKYVAQIEKGEKADSASFSSSLSHALFGVLAIRNSPEKNYEKVLLDIYKHQSLDSREIIALAPLNVLIAIKKSDCFYKFNYFHPEFFDLIINCKENKLFNELQVLVIELLFWQFNSSSLDEVDVILETLDLPADTKKKIYEFLGLTNKFIVGVSKWDLYREVFQILVAGNAKEIFDIINKYPQAFGFGLNFNGYLQRLLISNEKLTRLISNDGYNLHVDLFSIIIYKSHLKSCFKSLHEGGCENAASLKYILNFWCARINRNLVNEFSELENFLNKLSKPDFDNFFTEAVAFEKKLATFMERKCSDFINKISGKAIVASSTVPAASVLTAAASSTAKGIPDLGFSMEIGYSTTLLDLTEKPERSFFSQFFSQLFSISDIPITPDRQEPTLRS